jgi:hypothetical protein
VGGGRSEQSWGQFIGEMSNADNSAFGVYFKFSDDIKNIAEKRTKKIDREQRDNKGFMSFRKCKQAE